MTKVKPKLEERINNLEYQIAFQEDVIETLNQTVIHQETQIKQLNEQISNLAAKLSSVAEALPESSPTRPEDERPPHY